MTGTHGPIVMGVLNVTPDSFSDGGRWVDPGAAIEHALGMVEQGADIIDVGGESTRPGARPVPAREEISRIATVVRALTDQGVVVSVDTLHAETAAVALDEGAAFINDVSGGLIDPELVTVVARSDATFIAGHWGGGADATPEPEPRDVVGTVRRELLERAAQLMAAGIDRKRLVLDPGLGFGTGVAECWSLVAGLDQLTALGFPLLVGHSRKRFIASLLSQDAPMTDRDAPSAVVSVLAAQAGAWGVRVHDVTATCTALTVLDRVRSADARTRIRPLDDIDFAAADRELAGSGHA